MNRNISTVITIISILLNSCATYTPQFAEKNDLAILPETKILTSLYLIGDAGEAEINNKPRGLEILENILKTDTTNQNYILFLGNNSMPFGMPEESSAKRATATNRIDVQIRTVKDFKGKVIFMPGEDDWHTDGVIGLDEERKYIEKALNDKKSFWPSKGCSLKSMKINEDVQLIIIDSQWFLEDWNKNPTINDECEIKTRETFFIEVQDELKKNKGKTIVMAMHHPIFTNGPYGGKYSFRHHIFPFENKFPLPIIGSLITQILAQGAISPQDRYNRRYNVLMQRLSTMARDNERIIIASGHDHSLQYINDKGLKQIVSGSGSKNSVASLGSNGVFSYSGQGIAVLDIYTDGSSYVRFYGDDKKNKKNSVLFGNKGSRKNQNFKIDSLKTSFVPEINKSIYKKEETEKSSFFKALWGDHYRKVYSTPIKIPVATLDTLLGGFSIERQGGGQVTRSLRLLDKNGKRYSLRAMRKSVTQSLQKGAFVNTYLNDDFKDTFTEEFLYDFYTSSYPYAFMAVGGLADAIGVYHPNPKLYYIPKHAALGNFNKTFGDEIYFLEERPGKEFNELASFGMPDDIESTTDLIKMLRSDEEYQMDELHYIRTRLFDMIIGDWDRHSDQWRWARFDTNGKSLYRPIPKDRDQVFSNYDGALLNIIKAIVPSTRKFQAYDGHIKNIRWINESGIPLYRLLTQQATKKQWIDEATYIKEHLTDNAIDKAFKNIPIKLQDQTIERIKQYLKSRRDEVVSIASSYYKYMSKQVVILGTDKDDLFEITRRDHQTKVQISRIKGGEAQKPFYTRTILSGDTKEIWIYGLDDDDQFIVKGSGKNQIPIRIIGGQNNDEYSIENGKKVKIYDHKTKPNTVLKKGGARFIFRDNYDQNTYNVNKYNSKTNIATPLIGFNPDDGLNIKATNTLIFKGFNDEPYPNKHILSGSYFFATNGFDVSYTTFVSNAVIGWNFESNVRYTSKNYAQNFLGFGNETINKDDNLGLNYNRVKTGILSIDIGISKNNSYGTSYSLKTTFDGIEVQNSEDRYITSGGGELNFINSDIDFFKRKYFAGLAFDYGYESYDKKINPTRGMKFEFLVGTKTNVNNRDRTYGY